MAESDFSLGPGNTLGDVLIVDDEKNVCKVLKAYCEDLGIFRNIIVASDGVMAINKLTRQKFALILLDINLPKKGGLEVLKEFDDTNPNCKDDVLIISGMLGKEVLTTALQLGVKNFLIKPFDQKVFTAKAVEVIKAAKAKKAA